MPERLHTPLFGLDYTSPIPVNLLRAAGVKFVYRYVARSEWKCIKDWEAKQLKAAGIGICLVFEDYGFTNGLAGYAEGKADAEFALKMVFDRVGKPSIPRPIAYAVDTDRYTPQQVAPYFEGVNTVHRKQDCGPYGSYYVVEYFRSRGYGALFQTVAWSHGHISPEVEVYQSSINHTVNGYSVDYDAAYFADYGQWNYQPPAPADPFDVLLKSPFKFGDQQFSEYETAQYARGALKQSHKYAAWLGTLYRRLKLLRDRIWFVVHNRWDAKRKRWVPLPKNDWAHEWSLFNRGQRWQVLNNEMLKIAKAVKV